MSKICPFALENFIHEVKKSIHVIFKSGSIRATLNVLSQTSKSESLCCCCSPAQKPINMPVGGKESLLISDAGNWWPARLLSSIFLILPGMSGIRFPTIGELLGDPHHLERSNELPTPTSS